MGIAALLSLVLLWDILQATREIVFLIREKHIPLVVDVARYADDHQPVAPGALVVVEKLHFSPQYYATLGIEPQHWLFRHETPLGCEPDVWRQICRRILGRVEHLETLGGDKIYHIFLKCPATLALGLGAALGSLHRQVVYQYAEAQYVPVLDFSRPTREKRAPLQYLKQKLSRPFCNLTVQEPEQWTPDVYVSLNLASHSAAAFAEVAEAQQAAYVAVQNRYGNRLPLESDWIEVAREAVQAVQGVLQQPGVKQLHLALSAPLPLAWAIGMGLGFQSPVRVYNWYSDRRLYAPVLDLNHIRQAG